MRLHISFLPIWLAFLALCFGVLSLACLLVPGHAVVEMEVTGNSSGQGTHTLEILPDISNLTPEEATYLLGPAHGFNVSQDGLVTFENGSSWQIIRCKNTGMTELRQGAA